jgi:hypothetical protein
LLKWVQWERIWVLQRLEDAGEDVQIAVPRKYTSADFVKPSYWRARGKLDVPKERLISYPKAGCDSDGTELLGWASWDHLAQALVTAYLDRKTQVAWPAGRRLPIVRRMLADSEPIDIEGEGRVAGASYRYSAATCSTSATSSSS